MTTKPILCLDFDGVIHDSKAGWQNGEIYGDVTPGFFEWAQAASKVFKLVVYSSRLKDPDLAQAMKKWLIAKYNTWAVKQLEDHEVFFFEYAYEKPPAFLTIDDRAIEFRGDWNALDPKKLRQFKPWNAPTKGALK